MSEKTIKSHNATQFRVHSHVAMGTPKRCHGDPQILRSRLRRSALIGRNRGRGPDIMVVDTLYN